MIFRTRTEIIRVCVVWAVFILWSAQKMKFVFIAVCKLIQTLVENVSGIHMNIIPVNCMRGFRFNECYGN